jgi:cell wall-associated NlpC family hydrolase
MSHWIEKYLGVRWKTGGRSLAGADCWGLLRCIYESEFGIKLNEHPVPAGALANYVKVTEHELGSGDWNETDAPADGDVVAMGKDKHFSHVGVLIRSEAGLCLLHTRHAASSHLVPLARLLEEGWDNIKFYRHVKRPVH